MLVLKLLWDLKECSWRQKGSGDKILRTIDNTNLNGGIQKEINNLSPGERKSALAAPKRGLTTCCNAMSDGASIEDSSWSFI